MFHLFKVWFFFIGTTTIFVFITATFIRHRYKIDNVDTTNHSVLDIIFNQMEYVFRITTNQGKIQIYIKYIVP